MVVFDLDDTLYKEHRYVLSALNELARAVAPAAKLTPHQALARMLQAPSAVAEAAAIGGISEAEAVRIYREHYPSISLSPEALELLTLLKAQGVPMAIITDGRALAQRAKYRALGLDRFVPPERLLISEETGAEKTHPDAFLKLMAMCPDQAQFAYIGDNPAKDFIHPRALGWHTIMLRDRALENIHRQDTAPHAEAEAELAVDSLTEVPAALERMGVISPGWQNLAPA